MQLLPGAGMRVLHVTMPVDTLQYGRRRTWLVSKTQHVVIMFHHICEGTQNVGRSKIHIYLSNKGFQLAAYS
jgi:hypothetical protein